MEEIQGREVDVGTRVHIAYDIESATIVSPAECANCGHLCAHKRGIVS
jgi:hypothetical protein